MQPKLNDSDTDSNTTNSKNAMHKSVAANMLINYSNRMINAVYCICLGFLYLLIIQIAKKFYNHKNEFVHHNVIIKLVVLS